MASETIKPVTAKYRIGQKLFYIHENVIQSL